MIPDYHMIGHSSNAQALILLSLVVSVMIAAAGCMQPAGTSTGTPVSQTSSGTPALPGTTSIPSTSAPSSVTPPPVSACQTFTSQTYGFSITYPAGWVAVEKNAPETDHATRTMVVEITPPPATVCDISSSDCGENQTVMTVETDSDPGSDIDDFFIHDVAIITKSSDIEITKRNTQFQLSGVKADRLDYNLKQGQRIKKVMSAYTIIHGTGYIVTYRTYSPANGVNDPYTKYYNDAMDMFSSFVA